MKKLNDIQLALVLARLQEPSDTDNCPNQKRLLREECLGLDANGENFDKTKLHSDPFVRSMAYWQLKDYVSAQHTLLVEGTTL